MRVVWAALLVAQVEGGVGERHYAFGGRCSDQKNGRGEKEPAGEYEGGEAVTTANLTECMRQCILFDDMHDANDPEGFTRCAWFVFDDTMGSDNCGMYSSSRTGMAESLRRGGTVERVGQPIFSTTAAKCPDDKMDANCKNEDGSMMYGVLGCSQTSVSTSGAGTMEESYTYEQCLDYCTQKSNADSGPYHPYMTYRKYNQNRPDDPTPCHCWSGSERYFTQFCNYIAVSIEGARAGIDRYNTCLGNVKAEPIGSGGTGDPHLHFAHGGRADFRGRDGAPETPGLQRPVRPTSPLH